MEKLFSGLFDTALTTSISPAGFLLCLATAVVSGAILAVVFSKGDTCSRSFTVTLGLIPAVVCVVIIMVNGNIGAGVAVAGAFSLVRFRSAPGSAREIGAIFIAMAAGIVEGMGYIAYGILFTLLLSVVYILFSIVSSKFSRQNEEREMRITIPENLNYTEVFDDIFEKFTSKHELVGVKTTNLGSLFKLTYRIKLRRGENEKALIDALRCRNGNLEISCSIPASSAAEL